MMDPNLRKAVRQLSAREREELQKLVEPRPRCSRPGFDVTPPASALGPQPTAGAFAVKCHARGHDIFGRPLAGVMPWTTVEPTEDPLAEFD